MAINGKILVIDDEEALCEILKYNLEKEGYEVDMALSAEEALEKDLSEFDLFIVDVMMDRLSGFDFAKRIRSNPATENTPILFCSAMSDGDCVVMGLNIGGDDYVTKPFVIGEVMARVRALLRRARQRKGEFDSDKNQVNTRPEPDVVYKDLLINRNEKTAFFKSEEIQLTRREYDLLLFFLTHRNKIYSRQEIIEQVWGNDVVVSDRTIDTNITRLRSKIGNYSNNIITRQGFGYGFKETD